MKTKLFFMLLITILLTPSSFASYYTKQEIKQMVINEANRQGVSPSLALAIAKVESNFDAEALSHVGAKGVMQIMPKTAEDEFGVSRYRLYNPQVNISLGVKFIKHLIDSYNGRVDIALSHYNGGSNVKDRWGNYRVNPVTKGYVRKVFKYQNKFSHYDQNGYRSEETMIAEVGNDRIAKLKALQMHNLSRNLSDSFNTKSVVARNNTKVSDKWLSKRAKVKQWESIYKD